MRMLGQWTASARKIMGQFRLSFDEISRQADLAELRSELDALRSQRPLADVEKELNKPIVQGGPLTGSSPAKSSAPPSTVNKPRPAS
jgi:sec-independent protein translocase protein TatB